MFRLRLRRQLSHPIACRDHPALVKGHPVPRWSRHHPGRRLLLQPPLRDAVGRPQIHGGARTAGQHVQVFSDVIEVKIGGTKELSFSLIETRSSIPTVESWRLAARLRPRLRLRPRTRPPPPRPWERPTGAAAELAAAALRSRSRPSSRGRKTDPPQRAFLGSYNLLLWDWALEKHRAWEVRQETTVNGIWARLEIGEATTIFLSSSASPILSEPNLGLKRPFEPLEILPWQWSSVKSNRIVWTVITCWIFHKMLFSWYSLQYGRCIDSIG